MTITRNECLSFVQIDILVGTSFSALEKEVNNAQLIKNKNKKPPPSPSFWKKLNDKQAYYFTWPYGMQLYSM